MNADINFYIAFAALLLSMLIFKRVFVWLFAQIKNTRKAIEESSFDSASMHKTNTAFPGTLVLIILIPYLISVKANYAILGISPFSRLPMRGEMIMCAALRETVQENSL